MRSDPEKRIHSGTWQEKFALWAARMAKNRRVRMAGWIVGVPFGIAILLFAGFYIHYSRLIDQRLQGGTFRDSVNIYAAPLSLSVGDPLKVEDLEAELRVAGYEAASSAQAAFWRAGNGSVDIFPHGTNGASVSVATGSNGQIAHIRANGRDVGEIDLGSPLITTLSSKNEERLLVTFSQVPAVLVEAIVSAEDKRFFKHSGLDLRRIVKAAYVDFKEGRKEQGASTLTMQLVRGLWLEPDKLWRRKVAEAIMTVHLEREWSKEKIFETYVNEVYLGRQAAYSVHGFGKGARMFFGKDLKDISLAEAALLAGLVQRPSYFNPFRFPERARERRNLVLAMMRENHYITGAQYENAVSEPVRVAGDSLTEVRAPYFIDLVNDELQDRQPQDNQSGNETVRNVYSTIDLNLQRAAEEAVASGMKDVDKLLATAKGKPGPHAEAALIALDPHTGEIKAVVGGRDYARSQLDRILSKRPPGSVFKPFVYAAALNTAVNGAAVKFTAATTVDDTPTTFVFGGKPYRPSNFHGEVFGTLTLRQALAKSDNVAAVKVAEGVGYNAVVQMARRAGFNSDIQPTPAVALGAYQVTPLEIAGAYTTFANGGMRVRPEVISNSHGGSHGTGAAPRAEQTLDPRVNWLMVSLLEEVMRSGTAAGVRARGFALPAAGKTGTSHDGWFAGFTSQLLCVVWVGFDDYRELNLEGAKSALPIWTEFMKRATRMGAYRNAKEFPMPAGITQARICLDSGKLAGDLCEDTRNEYFVAGSEPSQKCPLHTIEVQNVNDTGPSPVLDAIQPPAEAGFAPAR